MTLEMKSLQVQMDCGAPGCEAGMITHRHSRIDPAFIQHHIQYHAYTQDPETRKIIGAECDCPRILDPPVKRKCYSCKGTGVKQIVLSVPQPGQKVRVRDQDVLEAIFGDNPPEKPGVVFDIQMPEDHGLELTSGLGVRVTWDKLTKEFGIPKNKQVVLWTFDLLELEIVR